MHNMGRQLQQTEKKGELKIYAVMKGDRQSVKLVKTETWDKKETSRQKRSAG